MTTTPPLRVAVLSPFALVRAGVTHLVHTEPRRAVVVDTAAHDGHLGHVDAVVYDLAGLDAADLQHLHESGVPVLGLCRSTRPEQTIAARSLGVCHFVPETVDGIELHTGLERVAGRARRTRQAPGSRMLTERELDILRRIGGGRSNRQIAEETFLSPNSVKTYIRQAYKKIGVTTRTQAVLWVVHHDRG